MSDDEEEAADEAELKEYVAQQDVLLHDLITHVRGKQKELDQLKRKSRDLDKQIQFMRVVVEDKLFRREVTMAATKPWYWKVLVLVTVTCLMGVISGKRWFVLVPLNWVSFLLVWRMLYLEINLPALVFALLVSAFTVYAY
jgi:hypothetical protein